MRGCFCSILLLLAICRVAAEGSPQDSLSTLKEKIENYRLYFQKTIGVTNDLKQTGMPFCINGKKLSTFTLKNELDAAREVSPDAFAHFEKSRSYIRAGSIIALGGLVGIIILPVVFSTAVKNENYGAISLPGGLWLGAELLGLGLVMRSHRLRFEGCVLYDRDLRKKYDLPNHIELRLD